jgi:hypothetical protein
MTCKPLYNQPTCFQAKITVENHLFPLSAKNLAGALFFYFVRAFSISAGFILVSSEGL